MPAPFPHCSAVTMVRHHLLPSDTFPEAALKTTGAVVLNSLLINSALCQVSIRRSVGKINFLIKNTFFHFNVWV